MRRMDCGICIRLEKKSCVASMGLSASGHPGLMHAPLFIQGNKIGRIASRDAAVALAEAEKLRGLIAGSEKRLANENFFKNAPEEVVNDARERLAALRSQLESVEQIIAELGG